MVGFLFDPRNSILVQKSVLGAANPGDPSWAFAAIVQGESPGGNCPETPEGLYCGSERGLRRVLDDFRRDNIAEPHGKQ